MHPFIQLSRSSVHPFIASVVHPCIRASKIPPQSFIRASVHPLSFIRASKIPPQSFIRSSVHRKFRLSRKLSRTKIFTKSTKINRKQANSEGYSLQKCSKIVDFCDFHIFVKFKICTILMIFSEISKVVACRFAQISLILSDFFIFRLKNSCFSQNRAEFWGAIILVNDHFSDHFRFRFWEHPKWCRAIILVNDHFSGYVLYGFCVYCTVTLGHFQ